MGDLGDRGRNERDNVEEDAENYPPERQNAFIGTTMFHIQSFSIEKELRAQFEGKEILKKRVLDEHSRTIVVDIVVKAAMREFRRLNNSIFEILGRKIVSIFKKEDLRTYYRAPVPKRNSKNQKSEPSKGKIPDKYRNLLKKMKKYEKSLLKSTDGNDPDDPDAISAKSWLLVNVQPWGEVEKNWSISRSLRWIDAQSEAIKTVADFIEIWPSLKLPEGYKLIELDFLQLKKLEKFELSFEQFENFMREVMSIRSGNQCSNEVPELVGNMTKEDVDENCKEATGIFLFPHLFPPKIKVTRRYKPSIADAQESLIIRVQTDEEKIRAVESKAAKLKKLKLPLQPLLIVVGDSWTSINDCYVSVNEILYKVPSVLRGLQLCFQVFHVLNADYPVQSRHLWCLIEEWLFLMPARKDSLAVAIISELQTLREVEAKKSMHSPRQENNSPLAEITNIQSTEAEKSQEDQDEFVELSNIPLLPTNVIVGGNLSFPLEIMEDSTGENVLNWPA